MRYSQMYFYLYIVALNTKRRFTGGIVILRVICSPCYYNNYNKIKSFRPLSATSSFQIRENESSGRLQTRINASKSNRTKVRAIELAAFE